MAEESSYFSVLLPVEHYGIIYCTHGTRVSSVSLCVRLPFVGLPSEVGYTYTTLHKTTAIATGNRTCNFEASTWCKLYVWLLCLV